jgi:hypothetical protein
LGGGETPPSQGELDAALRFALVQPLNLWQPARLVYDCLFHW